MIFIYRRDVITMLTAKKCLRFFFVSVALILCMSSIPSVLAKTADTQKNNSKPAFSDFDVALTGLISKEEINASTIEQINQTFNFQQGVYIPIDSQSDILKIVNSISAYSFIVDSDNHLYKNTSKQMDTQKSKLVSNALQSLISGNKTYIIAFDNGYFKSNDNGQFVKESLRELPSIRFENNEETLIILNRDYFNKCDLTKTINLISIISQDQNIKVLINQELVNNNFKFSLFSDNSNPVEKNPKNINGKDTYSKSDDTDSIQRKDKAKSLSEFLEKARKRLDIKIKENINSKSSSSNVSTFAVSANNTAVYSGPGSTVYAKIGSLNSGDTYEVLWNEFGWQYIMYSTSSGYKTGYIPGGPSGAYNSSFSTGLQAQMNQSQSVYAGTSSTTYAKIGSLSKNEHITVLITQDDDDYLFIEYSSSSGTKRGYVKTSSVYVNPDSALAKMNCNSQTYSGPGQYYFESGSVSLEEYVVVLEKNSSVALIEYNTKSGRKTAYIPLSSLQILNHTAFIPPITIDSDYKDASMNSAANVYGGPDPDVYAIIGSVEIGEFVGVINSENNMLYIQYYTSNGPKRGYLSVSQVSNGNDIISKVENVTKKYTGQNNAAACNATIYSGPGKSFATIGTVYLYEGITQFMFQQNSFSLIEYSTSNGTKRGYIANSDLENRAEGGLAIVSNYLKTYYGPNLGIVGDAIDLTAGSVDYEEYVTVLQKNADVSYVEYNTKKGRKRGYVSNSGLEFLSIYGVPAIPKYSENFYNSTCGTYVYAGPYSTYSIVGSIGKYETITRYVADVYGYSYIRYNTSQGYKTGYVPENLLEETDYNYKMPTISLPNVEKKIYGESGGGRELVYYKVGHGPNIMILNFCIHGFEDAWPHDGYDLVLTSEYLLEKLSSEEMMRTIDNNQWSVLVIPTSNPDGLLDGNSQNGKGRCTTTMIDSEGNVSTSHGIDMNRSFPTFFKPMTDSRNYTGSQPLSCKESRALRDLILDNRSVGYKNIFIDSHGWLGQIISKGGLIESSLKDAFGYANDRCTNIDTDASHGYVAAYASEVGYDAALFEFPKDVTSHKIMVDHGYPQKFTDAIIKILKDY